MLYHYFQYIFYRHLEISEIHKAHFQNVWGTSLKDATWSLTPKGFNLKSTIETSITFRLWHVSKRVQTDKKKKKKKKPWGLTIHSESKQTIGCQNHKITIVFILLLLSNCFLNTVIVTKSAHFRNSRSSLNLTETYDGIWLEISFKVSLPSIKSKFL